LEQTFEVYTLIYFHVPVCPGINPTSALHTLLCTFLHLHTPRYAMMFSNILVLVHTSRYFSRFAIKSMKQYIVCTSTEISLKSYTGSLLQLCTAESAVLESIVSNQTNASSSMFQSTAAGPAAGFVTPPPALFWGGVLYKAVCIIAWYGTVSQYVLVCTCTKRLKSA
jgi:hypothetical protein